MAQTTEDRPVSAQARQAHVLTLRLCYSGDQVLLPPTTITPSRGATAIGRDVADGITLPEDRRASRRHATLHTSALSGLRIIDEGSRNGTWVNGQRVSEALLGDGDVVSIGDSYLVVRAEPVGQRDRPVPGLLGTAPRVRELRCALHQVAPATVTVLLLAESGCGKEVAARALHELSGRKGPFVAVNCSAIPESLAESQLFGHVAGAFTGAAARPGLFRAADGGTLFLDEMGDLPPAIQPKLLRAIQDREVLPVGATAPVPCAVRIVAATNRDLRAAVDEGKFRGDLYARLAEFPLHLPTLRERREDVLLLLAAALGADAPSLSPALAEALLLHDWPFNVREVFALAGRLRILQSPSGRLELEPVADQLRRPPPAEAEAPAPPEGETGEEEEEEGGAVPDRAQLVALLRAHRGVIADVARAARRSRKQVYRWLAQHDLDAREFRLAGDGAGDGP